MINIKTPALLGWSFDIYCKKLLEYVSIFGIMYFNKMVPILLNSKCPVVLQMAHHRQF